MGPGTRSGARHGGRLPARGRSARAAAAARRRADALMAGVHGPGGGTAPAPVREADPVPVPVREAEPAPARVREPEPAPVLVSEAPGAVSGGSSRAGRLVSAVRERMPLWVRLRCGMAPRTPVVLGLVLLAAVGVAAFHFWSVRPQAVRAPEPVAAEAAAPALPPDPLRSGGSGQVSRPPAGAPPDADAGGSGSGSGSGQIVVDVSGKVRRPGVLRLPAGSRVADALDAAGGMRAGTDVTGLNRARVLTDGEQVVVGLPPGPPVPGTVGGGRAGADGPGGAPGGPGPSAPLSLNTATAEQLETLPGVGPVLAQHMIDYRTENNGFRSVDELRQVNGIGDRRFAELQPLVRP
ncbi:ComEA family DNA-binding protein [Streptomyces sp. NPDC051657]|uniref:ComEA family DNA-binding protein n=2 Tax=unclassified Streptomyces TaxID=2593676 RepID=UPI0034164502